MTPLAITHRHVHASGRWFAGLLAAILFAVVGSTVPLRAQAIITVNSTADNEISDTELTLREAIYLANGDLTIGDLTVQEAAQVSGTPGTGGGTQRDEIRFDIAGTGRHTIQPTLSTSSALPKIHDPVFINGLSQTGADCATWPPTLQIIINGDLAPSFASSFRITAGESLIRGLVINGFNQSGIEIRDLGNNAIECNFIGTDSTGTVAIPNSTGIRLSGGGNSNTIGGTTESERNLISGNSFPGISFSPNSVGPTNNNVVQGNFIGTDVTGTAALGNGGFGGIFFSGSSGAAAANNQIGGTDHDPDTCNRACNLISGNSGQGIQIRGFGSVISGTKIEGNFIGTALNGTDPLGNTGDGISMNQVTGNSVGGQAVGAGNLIANNGGTGVFVVSGVQNDILGNNIFANTDLGIDIDNAGVTGNDTGDPDPGANLRQNYPEFDSLPATASGGATTNVTGSLNSIASTTFRLEFFASQTCDASNFGQGERFLDAFDVTTDGSGDAPFNQNVSTSGISAGWFITATATDPNGNTSEFSQCASIAGSLIVTNTNNDGAGSLRAAVEFANVNPGTDTITFDIDAGTDPGCSSGVCTIQPLTEITAITSAVVIDGLTQTGADCSSWPPTLNIVLNGALGTFSTDGLEITGGGSTVRGLVIQDFRRGLNLISLGGNTVQCNYVGTDSDGLAADGNSVGVYSEADGTQIGGTAASDRNLVSGNTSYGVQIIGDNNTVEGNFMGTDATGAVAIGNRAALSVNGNGNQIGGTDHDLSTCNRACNVLSGSTSGYGAILPGGSSNTVEGNFIGTDLSGSGDLGNSRAGIGIFNSIDNTVGGLTALSRNLIAFNGESGVVVDDFSSAATGNSILGNAIHSNAPIGIDLGNDGVTDNDAGDGDSGPNSGQNFPELDNLPVATSGGATTNVTGSLDSAPNTTFRIEFFANESCSASNFGEGERFLETFDVGTNGSGQATINENVNTSGVPAGWLITATATDPSGNTSEFSNCSGIPANTALVTNTNDSGDGSMRAAIAFANTNPAGTMISFDIPTSDPGCDGSGVCTIQPTTAYPGITEEVVIDGTTQPGADCSSWPPDLKIMLDGTNAPGSAVGLTVGNSNSTVRGLVIGNFGQGVRLESIGNNIECNYIGTDVTGTSAEPNVTGVFMTFVSGNTIGGSTPTQRNVISGNSTGILLIDANGNTVEGNHIGTGPAGTESVGNTTDGVSILECTSNSIVRNVIANNGSVGVEISRGGEGATGAINNLVSENSIFDNAGLGIDLVASVAGATPNDSGDGDIGSNRLQNFPEISTATASGPMLDIDYVVTTNTSSAAYPIRVEFFMADSDPTNPEGRTFLGFDEYASGSAENTKQALFTPAQPVSDGDKIVATAIDADGNTSEFSAAATVSGSVLPVELVSFQAVTNDEGVVLSWETASETNNAGFEIQRRSLIEDDGDRAGESGGQGQGQGQSQGQRQRQGQGQDEGWQVVSFVEGHGTTTEPRAYQFLDDSVPFGAAGLVYRLKQTDFDGAFEFSAEIESAIPLPSSFVLHAAYPNPFRMQTTIRYELPQAHNVQIEVYDLLGRMVVSLVDGQVKAGRHETVFDASRLPSGSYFYRLATEGFEDVRQIMLVK